MKQVGSWLDDVTHAIMNRIDLGVAKMTLNLGE